jgi:hypothetical protein
MFISATGQNSVKKKTGQKKETTKENEGMNHSRKEERKINNYRTKKITKEKAKKKHTREVKVSKKERKKINSINRETLGARRLVRLDFLKC